MLRRKERAAEAKDDRSGALFFPDFALLEALVALALLAGLVVLAILTKAPLEDVASPNASGYVPRPEWYFLWLFQLLKYFKGSLEPVGTFLVPAAAMVLLLSVPFLDRRAPKTRVLVRGMRPVRLVPRVIAVIVVALLLTVTLVAASSQPKTKAAPAPAPAPEWPMRHLPPERPMA